MRVGLDWSEVQEFGLWCGCLVFGLHEHEHEEYFFFVPLRFDLIVQEDGNVQHIYIIIMNIHT